MPTTVPPLSPCTIPNFLLPIPHALLRGGKAFLEKATRSAYQLNAGPSASLPYQG